MPQSLANVLIHLVFSTKGRRPWIDENIEDELFRYLATICSEHDCTALQIGGTDDHVHIACNLTRTVTVSKLVEEIKRSSSKWMKTKGPRFAGFAWQNGYGAFSIGQSQVDDLKRYIAGQREHHRQESFQDELRKLLARYQIHYDEKYVWD